MRPADLSKENERIAVRCLRLHGRSQVLGAQASIVIADHLTHAKTAHREMLATLMASEPFPNEGNNQTLDSSPKQIP